MAFRSSEFCKRYEYVSFNLETPITQPAADANQIRNGYSFVVDNTNVAHPLDWHNLISM